MTKFLFALYLLISCITSLNAQNVTISGNVSNQQTGEQLIGATIVDTINLIGNASNKFGFYTLTVSANEKCVLQCSFIGYKTKYITIKPNNDTTINFKLKSGEEIDEVSVFASSKIEDRTEISKIEIPIKQIRNLPSISGEANILKAYQLMPGVQSGSEGNSGLFVRGGTPDQNLFLLDDVPLYNVTHLGGLYSVFDPSMVKSIELYKGGFPARYGGRVSSVIDVRNRDGNLYKYKGEIGFSLILSKFFIEGPIIKDKSSFAFSLRRSNLDIYSYLFNRLVNNPYNTGYTFYDINFKANYILSPNNRLFVSVYHGRDKYYYKEKENEVMSEYSYDSKSELKWGNSAASLRWYHVFSGKVFNNLTLAYTKYNYQNNNLYKQTNLTDNTVLSDEFSLQSTVNDIILKSDCEIPISGNKFRIGGKYIKHFFTPSHISYSQSLGDSNIISPDVANELNTDEIAVYAEFVYQLLKNLSVNAGVRAESYFVENKTFLSIQPRIIANYKIYNLWALKASYCMMQQNIHLLTNSNTGLPTDLWLPATKNVKPEKSKQLTIGIAHTTKLNYEFSIEAYHKTLNNLIEYKEGILLFGTSQTWENKIEKEGKGRVIGLEFLVKKNMGRTTGWIGYTLSKSERSFENIDNGNYFPFKYDQRHDFSITLNYDISEKLNLSGTWVYHTGHAITLPTGKYQLYTFDYSDSNSENQHIMEDVHIYSNKNAYRMPAYHKLDIGLNYTKKKKNGVSKWTVGVYNAYNRQNAYYLFFKETDGETKLYQQSAFPILLNFGYSFLF